MPKVAFWRRRLRSRFRKGPVEAVCDTTPSRQKHRENCPQTDKIGIAVRMVRKSRRPAAGLCGLTLGRIGSGQLAIRTNVPFPQNCDRQQRLQGGKANWEGGLVWLRLPRPPDNKDFPWLGNQRPISENEYTDIFQTGNQSRWVSTQQRLLVAKVVFQILNGWIG